MNVFLFLVSRIFSEHFLANKIISANNISRELFSANMSFSEHVFSEQAC